jgi:hypothetical protein
VRGSRKLGQQQFEHAVEPFRHIIVPEANDAVAERSEFVIALPIGDIVRVLAAVELDDQPRLAAQEVDEVSANCSLSDKLEAAKPPVAKA